MATQSWREKCRLGFMDVSFRFRQCPPSLELEQYVAERVSRLKRFEGPPLRAEITFAIEKSGCRIDVHIRGTGTDIHASVLSDNFFGAVDLALQKVGRQLEKKRDRFKKVS